MDYKKTRWRDITHELTGQVQFRPENSRKALNIPIVELKENRPLFHETESKVDNGLFIFIGTLPFTVILLWLLYEIIFN